MSGLEWVRGNRRGAIRMADRRIERLESLEGRRGGMSVSSG
jgi:hypothetical protein